MEIKEAIKIINQYDMNFHWNDGEPIPAEQLADAFDLAISALEKQEQERWVPLNSKGYEPEEDGEYLVSFDDGFVAVTGYYDGEWELWADSGEPTAWRKTPAPYQEDEV